MSSFFLLPLLFSLSFHFTSSTKFFAQVEDGHSFDFDQLAHKWGATYVGQSPSLPSVHVFETSQDRELNELNFLERNFPEGKILWVEQDQKHRYRPIPILPPEPSSRWEEQDPAASRQWHIPNVRADVAWGLGYSGQDIQVSVLDDGTNKASSDLDNLDLSNSWNYITGKNDPTPSTSQCTKYKDDCSHGTFCATLAVGETNDFCGVGIAPSSTLQGFAILSPDGSGISVYEYVEALSHPTYVSSNSYGPVSCQQESRYIECTLSPITNLEIAAFNDGIQNGRDGKGTIFVFASGNDGDIYEDTNLQETLVLRGVIAVGASTASYVPAYFSCPGAGLMCIAPGVNMYGSTIVIDNDSQEICQTVGSGTSFSTPVVAGAMSLLLEANPELSWRDVQHILVRSSYRAPSLDWVVNAAGREFSHLAGFGVLDVYGAIFLATNWTVFPEEFSTTAQNQTSRVVDSSSDIYIGVVTDLVVESVNLILEIDVAHRGGLKIELISPGGTTHPILLPRPDSEQDYDQWPTLARGFWDERSPGWWIVRVTKDSSFISAGKTTVKSVTLNIYGTRPDQYPENPSDPPQHDDPAPGQTSGGSTLVLSSLLLFFVLVF